MIDKLKTFVSKHKQEFDAKEPSQDLWKKIDARMEVKNSSAISSKWLSKLKYFGLSASVLIIAVYFISQNISNSAANELSESKKDSALNSLGEWIKTNQNKQEINTSENSITDAKDNGSNSENNSANNSEVTKSSTLSKNNTESVRKDSVNLKPNEDLSEQSKVKTELYVNSAIKEEVTGSHSSNEKKDLSSSITSKRAEASDKINSYSCSIWEGSSFCSGIKDFRFPGQVSVDGNIVTTSCSKLGNINDLQAIHLKGKTAKKLILSLTEDFKNIVLEKNDGSKINPVAISHYYTGLGVISGYKGKRFQMIFKDKVELILFFKDVEVGDKIMIDKTIEAVVSKP